MAEKKQIHQQNGEKQPPSLERRFDADLADIEADLEAWIEQSDSNIIEAQEKHIRELRKLIKTKASIEREILTITKELRAVYNESKSVLKVVLDGRASDYDEALKQLGEIKTDRSWNNLEASQEL